MSKFYTKISLERAEVEASNFINRRSLIKAAYKQLVESYDPVDLLLKIAELEDIYKLFERERWSGITYISKEHKLFVLCEDVNKVVSSLREAYFFSGGKNAKICIANDLKASDSIVVAQLKTDSIETFLTTLCCYTFAETLIDDLNLLVSGTVINRSNLIAAKESKVAELEAELGSDMSALKLIIS